MKVLMPIFSPAGGGTYGGLTRALALAIELEKQGDQVAFCASGPLCNILEKKGYKYYSLPEPTLLGLPKWISKSLEKRLKNMKFPDKNGKPFGNIWLAMTVTSVANKEYLKRAVEKQLEIIKEYKPDIIFTELDGAAHVASKISGVPIATTYASVFSSGKDTIFYKKVEKSMNSVLQYYGIEESNPFDICFDENVLKIVPSIPELEDLKSREDIIFVGNLLGDLNDGKNESFKPEPGKKYVFVYTGTISVSLKEIENKLPSIFKDRKDIICMVVSQSIKENKKIGNIEFRNFVLDTQIIPYCELVICHGGHNTIIRSLLNGVPPVIFPGGHFERRYNAMKVAEQNAGVLGEMVDFNIDWFNKILDNKEVLKKNAARLKDIINSYPGPVGAVEHLKLWAQRQKEKDKHQLAD